jgi:hypothetical protein
MVLPAFRTNLLPRVLRSRRRWLRVLPKRVYTPARLRGVIAQKTRICTPYSCGTSWSQRPFIGHDSGPLQVSCLQLCILYNQRDATYTMFFYYYYQRPTCFGRCFGPSSRAYKTVCATLGIAILSCRLPLVWTGSRAVDSRKTWQYQDCTYNFISCWWWAEEPPETCRTLITIKNIV